MDCFTVGCVETNTGGPILFPTSSRVLYIILYLCLLLVGCLASSVQRGGWFPPLEKHATCTTCGFTTSRGLNRKRHFLVLFVFLFLSFSLTLFCLELKEASPWLSLNVSLWSQVFLGRNVLCTLKRDTWDCYWPCTRQRVELFLVWSAELGDNTSYVLIADRVLYAHGMAWRHWLHFCTGHHIQIETTFRSDTIVQSFIDVCLEGKQDFDPVTLVTRSRLSSRWFYIIYFVGYYYQQKEALPGLFDKWTKSKRIATHTHIHRCAYMCVCVCVDVESLDWRRV